MSSGLFETHLTVSDLDVSIEFYKKVVHLELAHLVRERHVAFFWIGGRGRSMLGLWSQYSSPLKMQLHLAMTREIAHVTGSVEELREAGVTPRDGHGRPTNEPVVIGWMPAVSVFFDDPDGNLLEWIAMLPDEPRPGVGFVPLSEWRRNQLVKHSTGEPGA